MSFCRRPFGTSPSSDCRRLLKRYRAVDAFLAGLEQVAQLPVLVALLVGAISGVIIGAIPGLGPAVGIAILLPSTFKMEPLVGLTLLLGIYSGAWYGGAIPAILINTPGTVVSVLTTFDGYPMARRGEARRALSLAYSSSFVGGIVSVVVLALMAPLLAAFAKRFGSAEFAMAALLGLVLVVVAHRGKVMAAAMTLGFGLFLSTIGLETAFASARFTFRQDWLLGGIPLVPMGLGLFAISQAFTLIVERGGSYGKSASIGGSPFQGLFEVFRYPRTLFRSAGFGVGMGILPGVGEFVAQFFSYTFARRTSKTPELFGRGAPEGLIASETANNAVPASAMVPLLALGIPGEALTAMMLAVFLVHNVTPGPTLFETRPEFISGLYMSLFLMNVVILIFLLVATRWIVLVTRLESRMIGVGVLALSMVGTFTQNYRLSDSLLSLGFGLIGYVLRRTDVPIVPIILGLVLGPILEARVRQAVGTAAGNVFIFVERPISAAILGVILAIVGGYAYSVIKQRRKR